MTGPDNQELRSPFADDIELASEMLRRDGAAKSLAHITARALDFSDMQRPGFEDEVVWGTIERGLRDPQTDLIETLTLLMYVSNDQDKGSRLTELGEELSQDGELIDRSHTVLRKAARVFEDGYELQAARGVDGRASYMQDYLKVADVQTEAGDRAGACRTALAAAPHVIEIADELETLGLDGMPKKEDAVFKAISHIGPRYPAEVKRLFGKLCNPDYKRAAVKALNVQVAADLVAELRMDESIGVMVAQNMRPTAAVWEEAMRAWLTGNQEKVSYFIDDLEKCIPGFYDNCSQAEVNDTAMHRLLFKTGKDHILIGLYTKIYQQYENFQPMKDFAFWCGLEGERSRLEAICAQFGVSHWAYDEMVEVYERGRQQAEASQAA